MRWGGVGYRSHYPLARGKVVKLATSYLIDQMGLHTAIIVAAKHHYPQPTFQQVHTAVNCTMVFHGLTGKTMVVLPAVMEIPYLQGDLLKAGAFAPPALLGIFAAKGLAAPTILLPNFIHGYPT